MTTYNTALSNMIDRDGDVIEIIPAEEYDSHRAKIKSSLSWLLSKVYGSHVPKELKDPFYETAQGQLHLRPVLVNLLSSSELYCQACSNMFPETHTQWQGHWSIIQVLSRKGIYISETQDSAVTETVLVQTAPFRLQAHLALIDALMKAFTHEVASLEKVVKAVRHLTAFQASSELPDTSEDALRFWINKVCTVLATEGWSKGGSEEIIQGSAGQRVRVFGKSVSPRESVQVPLLEDLMRDIGDGCSVGALIAFYRPHFLNIKDLCLKENIGIADSLHNLRQIGRFCQSHLPWKCFHLSYEDLLYTHETMRVNIIAFLADLFYCFEGPGSSQVDGSGLGSAKQPMEKVDAIPSAGKKNVQSMISDVPISLVTKRSFQRQSFEDTANNLGMGRPAISTPNVHQPLLPRRGRRSIPQEEGLLVTGSPPTTRRVGRRTLSLCSPQDRETVHRSVLAWQDDQRVSPRSEDRGSRSGLLANVSIDSEMNQSFNANNSLSLDLSGLDSSGETVVGPGHPDYMELESVSSGHSRRTWQHSDRRSPRAPYATQAEQKQEPLTPAFLRPTKERESSLSKAEERGDRLLRRRKPASPTQQSPTSQYSQQLDSANLSSSLSVSSDETTVSSLAPGESQSPRYIQGPTESGQRAWATHSLHEDLDPNRVVSPSGKVSTPQAVHTAEFPVSSNIGDVTSVIAPSPAARTADSSREGSISSSGEFSDHESRKIHQEYKVRESGLTATLNTAAVNANSSSSSSSSMPVMIMSELLDTTGGSDEGGSFSKSPSSTTSFAELKRLKDRLCFSLDKDPSQKQSSCDSGNAHSAGQHPGIPSPVTDGAVNGLDPPPSELQQLRLKLEQKRKEIERKKHRQETQQNKMRQRLGKAAFMRVVTQHLDGREEDELTELPETKPDHLLTSTQAQLQARLGHSAHKFPVGGSYRSQPQVQPFSPTLAIGHGGQSTVTDWKAQSHLLRGANGDISNFAGTVPRPGNLTPTSYFGMPGAGTATAGCVNSDSSSAGHITGIKAFSREGIQQTIDNVRNRYFKSDTSIVPGTGRNTEEAQVDEVSYRSHGVDQIPGTTSSALQDQIQHSSHNQPFSLSASHSGPTRNATPAIPIPSREAVLLSSSCTSLEHPEYDSSLDKLNNSLSELQGEIMRMSLQQDQFKTPCSPGSDGFIPRMIQSTGSVPLSSSYESAHQATIRQGQQPFNDTCNRSFTAMKGDSDLMANVGALPRSLSGSCHERSSYAQDQVDDESEPAAFDSPSDGFFVSFDDETTPTQSKPPPMLEQQARGLPSSHNTGGTSVASHGDFMANINGAASYHNSVTAGQAVVDTHSGQMGEIHLTDSSPKVGFIIKDEASIVRENAIEDEMQKKRIKLLEMQRKRKEEQETRKTKKEAEVARKHEEKQIKEEEQERKKAEEKARREVIFQQYLQKKQEEDEAPAAKPKPKRRDGSASKPRPKSMFAKSKAMTPEPGALAPDSGSSSQEDLSGRATFGGRATPGIMSISAMRASFHACLPQPSLIRKAVSCNVLQGASNVSQGPSPNRRPPSPDLYKLKQLQQQQQQRPRGNSQDSGSETGSGSNAGSDYSGPKLFVKPSSRSNRHIIVNAISHCCLAGSVNTDMKNRVLEELSKCEANHFLILFRDAGCQYRGLFIFHPETEEAYKVHGVGPKHIANEMCEKFYKYNSGGKSFSEITSTKHLSVSVDAVVLHGAVWKSGKAAVKR